jgi:hypothetical protein
LRRHRRGGHPVGIEARVADVRHQRKIFLICASVPVFVGSRPGLP